MMCDICKEDVKKTFAFITRDYYYYYCAIFNVPYVGRLHDEIAGNIYLFMVALCNRADHIYFHAVVCSSSSLFFFFPRLISAAADWMSAILPHMVWP